MSRTCRSIFWARNITRGAERVDFRARMMEFLACRLLRIDKGRIRRRKGFHYGGVVGDVFKVRIGGKQRAVAFLELVASLCLALHQCGRVAFVWQRIFFASGRDVAGWFY